METTQNQSQERRYHRFVVLAILPFAISLTALISAVCWSYYCLSFALPGTVVRPLNLTGDVILISLIAAAASILTGSFAIWFNRKRLHLCLLAIIGILSSILFVLPIALLAMRWIIQFRGLIDEG